MTRLIALLSAATLALIALVHVYWALGGRIAWLAAVPEVGGRPAFTPGRSLTLAVALALGLAGLLVATTGGWLPDPAPRPAARLLTGLLALVFVARAIGDFRRVGFFKRERGTRFARLDSTLYAPLCLALGVALLLVAGDAP